MQSFLMIGGGLAFIFAMTCLGGATVFLFRKSASERSRQIFLGFAVGVMIAVSIWGLLLPSIELAEEQGLIGWIPAACGFASGALFLLLLDHIIPHIHLLSGMREGPSSTSKRTMLFFLAMTLHNIPEGMAVGLSFALALQHDDPAMYSAAIALAIGIGIQNLPEGAAVSLPLRREGISPGRSFGIACLSGIVEPIFGVLTVLLAMWLIPVMPWLLSFAAGAMIYVVMEELIPESRLGDHSHIGTMSVIVGFLLMMILDIALG
ncbi:MAG: ZIP family metal transporter [Oscillospiraceae bacterium]|nr:ZIP family metal transporter [Oscillospiraceae bacterium]